MDEMQARAVLKKHAAIYGDSKYEPARWVIDAMQAAVAEERERCMQHINDLRRRLTGSTAKALASDCAARVGAWA